MADVNGLLDGFEQTLFPTAVPQGAAYDLNTMRMARAALLGNIGASLLAAGQGGQSPDQRAALLGRLGLGPSAASEILSRGTEDRLRQTEIRKAEQEMADKAARDKFYRESLTRIGAGASGQASPVPSAAPVSAPPPGGAGAATPPPAPAAAPADPGLRAPYNVEPITAKTVAAANPAPVPLAQPAAVQASVRPTGGKTWWEQLQITPQLAAWIANQPDAARQQIMTKLITDRATPREVWQTIPLQDGRVVQRNSLTNEVRKALDGPTPDLGGVPKHIAEQEQALRGEFYKETKDFTDRQTAYMTMRDLAKRGEGVSDQALVLSLMKVFDPTSTVTSTEAATAQNAAGVPEQIRSLYNGLTGGGKLSPEIRRQLVVAAEQRYGQEYDTFGRRVDHYTTLSKQYGADPSRVIQDTRDKGYGFERQVRKAGPDAIMQMSPEQLRSIPRELLNDLSAEQLQAIQRRLQAGK